MGVSDVARRYGVSRGLLQTCRRTAMRMAVDQGSVFVPLRIADEPAATPVDPAADSAIATAAGLIELEGNGLRVRFSGVVDTRAAPCARPFWTADLILGVPPRPGLRIMVASKPVDFRKGMDSLAALVMQTLACDPFTGDVFLFRSKRSDRLEVLIWDGSGLCLITKRLENRRVHLATYTRRGGDAECSPTAVAVYRNGLDPARRRSGASRIKASRQHRRSSETPPRFGTLWAWRLTSFPCRASLTR